jgi:metal-responsive CopG/Arc/MetJ family transcriptional regulator
MKTVVSIPDAIFEKAERLAKRRGISRSELYAMAIHKYVKSPRTFGVRERLDAVYARDREASRLDPPIAAVHLASFRRVGQRGW